MITRTQIAALVALIDSLRSDWDRPGTASTLEQYADTDADPHQLFTAALTAAADPDNETPKAMTWAKYWQPAKHKKSTPGSPRARDTCPVDGHSGWAGNCPQCRSEQIAKRDPQPCPKPGHHYWTHNCLDCRRDAAKGVA